MSVVSDIMEAIRSEISTAYTSKKELVNRVSLEQNPDFILADGFDVVVGAGTNNNELRGRGSAVTRDISIILTKRVTDSDLQNNSKHLAEKTLLDEMIAISSLVKTKESVVRKCLNIEFAGDSGISVLNADKIKFISTELNFTIWYVEIYN